MKISKNGIDFIKKHEGLSLVAYRCPAGVLTIGYGHTGGVLEGEKISKGHAENLFKKDLESFERFVSQRMEVELTQNQFDALVSFCYNVGVGNFLMSWVLKFTNEKKFKDVRGQFMRWVYASNKSGVVKKKKVDGLVKRRTAEADLYENGLKLDKTLYSESLTSDLISAVRGEINENSKKWNELEKEQKKLHKRNIKLRSILGDLA